MTILIHQSFIQCCTNATEVAAENNNLAPYVLVVGDAREAMQAFLVADCHHVIAEVRLEDISLALMSVLHC